MAVKRLISEKQKNNLKSLKKHKGKNPDTLKDAEIRELVILIAKKLGIL